MKFHNDKYCYVRWLKLTLIEEVSFRHKQNIYICLCDI